MPYIDKVSLDGTVYDVHDTDLRESVADELDNLKSYVAEMSPLISVDSAAVLSVPDAAPLDAEAAVVAIAPSQNLHGYANPWPAGGGKNKFDRNAVTADKLLERSDGSLSNNSSYAVSDYIPVSEGQTITFTGFNYYYQRYYNSEKTLLDTLPTNAMTATIPSGVSYLRVSLLKTNLDTAQIELGSTATSYAPYSNICPISGWTGATVRRTGKNLFDQDNTSLSGNVRIYGASDILGLQQINTLPAGTYTLSFVEEVVSLNGIEPVETRLGLYLRAESKGVQFNINAQSDIVVPSVGFKITKSVTFTLTEEYVGKFKYFYVYSGKNIDYGEPNQYTAVFSNIQLEPGSVATPYEPYQGDTYTVAFPSAAGTVYGGILDLVAGTLTVDRAGVDLSTLTWTWDSTYEFWRTDGLNSVIKKSSASFVVTKSICEEYKAFAYNTFQVDKTIIGFAVATTGRVAVRNGSTTVKPTNDMCYELATPIPYTLDPVTLTLLRGANVVWADCGDMSVSYRQDVATLLSALTAPDETDMTADANYAANSFFTVGGTLYRATAAIATGETIQPGVNCAATSIAEQLTYLYTQI